MWRDVRAVGWSAAMLCFVACGDAEDDRSPERQADGRALLEVVSRDGALASLEEVDHLVRARRPVRAAEILRGSAFPAVRRQREAIAAVRVVTPEGTSLRERLLAVYARRGASLAEYAEVLERGEVEDERLASALHAQATAERDVAQALAAVETMARDAR